MRPLPSSLVHALGAQGEGLTVLVVRLGALGDILRTLPPVRLLRRALPRATIHWVLEEKWAGVLRDHPDLNGLLPMPRERWRRSVRAPTGWPGLIRSIREFRAALRECGAGLVLDFHGNLRSGWTSRLSGAPVRIGYAGHQQKEGNRSFNTHHVASGVRRTPRMERNLDLIRALRLPDRPLPPAELPMVAAGASRAAEIESSLGRPDTPFAVISPGASRAQAHKKPPASLLSAASRRLARDGVASLVVWGPGEEQDATRVTDEPASEAKLAPPTDLPTLAALLARARLFVGGDSGPLHLACAVGCPVVGIYGPTDPVVNSPWGVPYRTVAPEDRSYTGIKRLDRRAGGFDGLHPTRIERSLTELLAETG